MTFLALQIGDIVDEAFREKAAQNMFVAPGGMETALAQQREVPLTASLC